MGSILRVCVEEEEWKVVYVTDGQECETERVIILRGYLWRSRCAKGVYEAESDYTRLIEFIIKSARKLVVEPPMTVGLRFCFAAFHDVSCD